MNNNESNELPQDDLLFFDDLSDQLTFEQEDHDDQSLSTPCSYWTILMIDDDEQVHQSTVLALGDEVVLGKRLYFQHAYSAKEALDNIDKGQQPPDLAFVDMVMESADAGLRFATAAKTHPQWLHVKILLRSGQPGFSNEIEQAKAIGVEGFAQKANISRSILIQALIELLSGRHYFMNL